MWNKSGEQFLFNHGWEHFWCTPKNVFVKEFIKGPFLKPKLLNSIPYVTLNQEDGSSVRLQEGIPDCWAEYLAHNFILLREYLGNYELMHKEDVEIVPQLRKNYRLYIGQGIPDPWTSYQYVCNPEINTHLNSKDIKRDLVPISRSKKGNCYCYEKKYLFGCRDKNRINTCRCRDCHDKNTPLTTDCGKNCKCISVLRDWVLKNAYLKRRKSQGRKPTPESDQSSQNDSKTEDKGPRPKAEPVLLYECPGHTDSSEISTSDLGEVINEKPHNSNCRNKVLSKNQTRICCCPYGKNVQPKKNSTEFGRNCPEFIVTISKQIQTENEKDSKTVQTDNPKPKVLFKCHCNNACPNCGLFQCTKSWAKAAYATPQSLTNVCFTPGLLQNPTILCPYSFPNHVIFHKPHKHDKVKKEKKLEKSRDTEEASNLELRGKGRESRSNEENVLRKSDTKVLAGDTKNEDFNTDKSINCYQPFAKSFDQVKYLTDEKLKYYLQGEERHSRGQNSSKFVNFCKGNPSASSLNPERFKLERFKTFSNYKPRCFEDYLVNEKSHAPRVFNSSDQATMTILEGTQKSQKERASAKLKHFKELGDSDEFGSFSPIRECTDAVKANRRRRRLLANRKRRRRLVSSGKCSILEYQALINKLPKRPELVNKQVQVEGTEQDCHFSKKFFTENNPSVSGLPNFSLRHRGASLDSNPLIARAMKRIDEETAESHLGEYSKSRIPGESTRRSDIIFGTALGKISNNNSTWTSKALKHIIDDLLVEKKSQEI